MLKTAFLAALTLGLGLGLGGCVAVWGKSYHVEAATPDTVTIKYDDHFGSFDEVRQAAQASCREHGRNAVQAGEPSTSLWGLSTVEFSCVQPS